MEKCAYVLPHQGILPYNKRYRMTSRSNIYSGFSAACCAGRIKNCSLACNNQLSSSCLINAVRCVASKRPVHLFQEASCCKASVNISFSGCDDRFAVTINASYSCAIATGGAHQGCEPNCR